MSHFPRKKTIGNTDWFVHDRFGMFIHFGLYALPARHEWIKNRESISEEKYQEYFDHFNPDLMDARDWARQAKAAGMKYAVLTSKHHEGFCLFDSQYTDYKSTNTPCGRDLVREYVDAFRAEGLKIGFYYSLIDWHHPDFPIDVKHPRRNDANAKELDQGRDMKKYAEYMRNQVTELLTNYGKIDILWFDFSYPAIGDVYDWMQFGGAKGPEQWEADKMLSLIRKLQPEIILNDRLGIPQDLVTPEQSNYNIFEVPCENGLYSTWETCQTFSGSWGYYRDETSWKTPKMLIDMLVRTVARGGNLIMNVGPTGRGNFDARAEKALQAYADWIRVNGRSIYGCTKADPTFQAPPGVELTQTEDETKLYIHLLDYPFYRLVMKGLADRIEYIQLLSDASEIKYETRYPHGPDGALMDPQFTIFLPGTVFETTDPVLEVFLKPKK